MEYMPALKARNGENMYIVVYEIKSGIKGQNRDRPLAMFRNPHAAKVFLNMVKQNGRTAFSRVV